MNPQRILMCFMIVSFTLIMGTTIKNSRVIVTGGANGIGKAYAQHLLLNGAKVVAILDEDVENGTLTTKILNNRFGENRSILFPTDICNQDQFERSFRKVLDSFGGLDIMINNAGIMNDREWNQMFDTNINGVIHGTLLAIEAMGKHKGGNGGTIVNIASVVSLEINKYVPVYSASKCAVLSFSRSIALDYDKTGVAIKIMCPDSTNTSLMTNSDHIYLDFFNQDETVEAIHSKSLQRPEAVAIDVMRLIEDAPNGAIWVTSLNSPTLSLDIPEYRDCGTPV